MFSDTMIPLEIKNDGCLNGKQKKGKRNTIRLILSNLLRKAGYEPGQFEASLSSDGRKLASITGNGCEFRNMSNRDLVVSVVVGGEHFIAKLSSNICKPQTLNQDIRKALQTSGKDEFKFSGEEALEKAKPKPVDTKPKTQISIQSIPQTPMQAIKTARPDLEQSLLADVNLLAAHTAIYKEVGNHKDHPFAREEAQDWMNSHGLNISHHAVTGRIMGSLIRRGLYIKNDEKKTWNMTPLGVEVAEGKSLPEDETPKKPRAKRGSARPVEAVEGEAGGDEGNPQMTTELKAVLAVAGFQADCVKDLVTTCRRLQAIAMEQSILLENKAKLIARLEENSAGILVVFLRQSGIID